MTKVVVDQALRSKLHELTQPLELWDESGRLLGRFMPATRGYGQPVELCDSAGHVVGRFLPAIDRQQFEGLDPQIGPEELRFRKQNQGKTYTTAEVLARLEKS
jgi:hypothetical protein